MQGIIREYLLLTRLPFSHVTHCVITHGCISTQKDPAVPIRRHTIRLVDTSRTACPFKDSWTGVARHFYLSLGGNQRKMYETAVHRNDPAV